MKKVIFKYVLALSLVVMMLFLTSCSLGLSRTEMLNRDSDDKKAGARLEQVIETIKNKDKDALKAMFSKQALDEADDFDGSMDYLFEFIQGEIDSWEKSSGPTVFESNDYGHKTKEVSSYYDVNTDLQKYFFLLRDYPVDTDHPDNVGLYMLLVVKAEDEEKIWDGDQKIIYDGDQKLSHAGIYIPIEDTVQTSNGTKYTYSQVSAEDGSFRIGGINLYTATAEELKNLSEYDVPSGASVDISTPKSVAETGADILSAVFDKWTEAGIVVVCKNSTAHAWIIHGQLENRESSADGVGVAVIDIESERIIAIAFGK